MIVLGSTAVEMEYALMVLILLLASAMMAFLEGYAEIIFSSPMIISRIVHQILVVIGDSVCRIV
jgi:hypothetical protein